MPFVSIYSESPPSFPFSAFSRVQLTCDISEIDSNRRIEKVPRVYVNDTEIAVRSVNWVVDETRTGTVFSAVLHKISDRSLLEVEGATITFQLGSRPYAVLGDVPVDFTYETIIEDQKLENVSFQMAGDTVGFVTYPSNKLTLAPTEHLIINDDVINPVDVSEMETIYDDQGRTYETEVFSITDLTWLQAAEEIFVNRLEFDSIETDIEDFEVPILHFPIAEPYSKGFAPAIGTFNPRIYAVGNVLHIKNGWAMVPSDFPEPRDLTFEGCEEVQIVREFSQADCVRLSYSEGNGQDYVTFRTSIKTTDNGGSVINNDLVTTVTTKVFRQYRNYTAPDIIEKEELSQELIEIFNGIDVLSNRTYIENTVHHYDIQGRVTDTTKTVSELVPDPDNPGEFIWQEESKIEFTEVAYAQHPFDIRRSYESKVTRRVQEIKVIDTDNPYEWNRTADRFDQPLSDADRAGNIKSGVTYSALAPVKTFTDTFTPHRNGQVTHNTTAFDHVQNRQIYNYSNPRVGDVALNGQFARTRQMYVFETAATTKGTGTIIDVAGGWIPLRILIPLSRTILQKLRTRNRRATLNRIPIDTTINLSTQFTAKDKLGTLEGKFRVSSYTCSGSATDQGNSWSMQITGVEL